MQDYDARLGILSDTNLITDRLSEKFKEKYLDVIVNSNPEKLDITNLNYLIINLLDEEISLVDVERIIDKVNCKTLVLFPLFVDQSKKYVSDVTIQKLIEANPNLGVLLVPELLGDSVKYIDGYVSHDLIRQSLLSDRIKIINSSYIINAVSVNKLIEVVIREIFSFGISGEALAVVGPRYNSKSFCAKFLGIDTKNIISQNKETELVEVSRTASLQVNFSMRLAVNFTRNMFLSEVKTKEEVVIEGPVTKKNKIFDINLLFKRLSKLLVLVLFSLTLPLFSLLISIVLLYSSSKYALTDNELAQKIVNLSLKSVTFSQKVSFGIPIYYNYSNVIYKTSTLFSETLELSGIGGELLSNIIGENPYDLSYYSNSISGILDRIYTDIGFLQIDIYDLNDFFGRKINNYLLASEINISEYKDKVYSAKRFSSRLLAILGGEKPVKYLVILQNNMELRPTGGFIGSFALVTFDKGRMTEIVVNDVYSADGQLKGHVDPPMAIRTHLGEGGWYMRDSNWDPDFANASKKIEWFLDKEVNTKVDGVISVDLNFVQSLLQIVGPIKLVDFDKTITSDNLYEITQSEVESNFFPGSIKKASFLTGLTNQLILEIKSIKKDKYFLLIKEFYKLLEEKHMQLYFHDENAQEAIDSLNYSGKVNLDTNCGQRCYFDKYALVDANLGVNKANYFISRTQDLGLTINRGEIKHELVVTYINSANIAVGNSGTYKSYSRLLLPSGAKVVGVRLYTTSGDYENLNFDTTETNNYLEVGYLINVLPSSLNRVQIVWTQNTSVLSNGGEYRLLVRKQAGTDKDALKVEFKESDLSLTGRVSSVYTTDLVRDFSLKLFLQP